MGSLPKALEAKRVKLMALAQRQAFDSYLRYGRVPDLPLKAAEYAMLAEKALNPSSVVSIGSLPSGKPTTHYVWRTAGDQRVRPGHAAHDGQIFAWDHPPAGGHPGSEPNCRCWAERYYGDPNVPDGLLTLTRSVRSDTSGTAHWTRIETIRRPDGSLAQSDALSRDGGRILTRLSGTQIEHQIYLAGGKSLRLLTKNGVQTAYLGGLAVLQSKWTATGPIVKRARRHMAFLLEDASDPNNILGDFDPNLDPDDVIDPAKVLSLNSNADEDSGLIGLGLLFLQNLQQASPTSLGLGEDDVPTIAVKVWTNGKDVGSTPVRADAVTAQQAEESCPLLPEVQEWADEAATFLASQTDDPRQPQYGRLLHLYMQRKFEALAYANPLKYAGVSVEYSVDESGNPTTHGADGSTRLDFLELVPPIEPTHLCIYDSKTGNARLEGAQLRRIFGTMSVKYPGVPIRVFQITPNTGKFSAGGHHGLK